VSSSEGQSLIVSKLPRAVEGIRVEPQCQAMSKQQLQNNPILARFRAALAEVYGDRLERVVLYGSRARSDHRPDSDYDIAVFIKEPGSFYDECGRLAAITTDILEDTGAVISATSFPAGAYRERTGFMHELRRDGLDL
jgi:predicted nucleotidyltransferase